MKSDESSNESRNRSVVVVGGGPAGLMAAGTSASRGAHTVILEKMSSTGRKLSITGKGRCNLTNSAPLEQFLEAYGPNGRFLRQQDVVEGGSLDGRASEQLLDSVAKACKLEGYRVLVVKKGGEGVEGLETQRPLTTGLSPVLLGDFVTLEQGTGCVHIAPGHGMEDYILVLEHNTKASSGERLEILAPVDDAGRFTDIVKDFAGQHVFKANPGIVEHLQALHLVAAGHVHRSDFYWRSLPDKRSMDSDGKHSRRAGCQDEASL